MARRFHAPISLSICLSTVFAIVPSESFGDAFRNPYQSASAIAQGTAFAAQADDPSALYYNPAGMTQLKGIQQSFGIEFVSVRTNYTSPAGVSVSNQQPVIGLPPPGQIFLTAQGSVLGVPSWERVTFGLGLLNLYGFGVKYPDSTPFATSVTSASLPLLDIKPTIAVRVLPRLSVGIGADIFTFASFVGEGHFEQQFKWPGGFGIAPGSQIEVNGTGTTAAMNASLLYTPLLNTEGLPLMNIAFVWRSQAVLPLSGSFLVNGTRLGDITTNFRFPESFTMGLAGWPIRNQQHHWKVEIDVDYVRWQSVRNADLHVSTGLLLPAPLNWSNAVSIGAGTEYKWLQLEKYPGWQVALRAGYYRTMTPIPDVSFTPSFPDANINAFSIGLGFLCGGTGHFLGMVSCDTKGTGPLKRRALGVDLAYQVLLFEPRTVVGNANPTVDGLYHTTTHAGTLTFRVNL